MLFISSMSMLETCLAVKQSTHLLHVTDVTNRQMQTGDRFRVDMDSAGSNNHLETQRFSESHVFFEARQEGEKREETGRKKQVPFLNSRVTLCW